MPDLRILGLDFGTKRVGAAISDPRLSIATPLEVYHRRDPIQDARHYRELVTENDVSLIVIGLPVHISGRESQVSRQTRDWGAWLAEVTGVPVRFLDERYTTSDAEDLLREAGLRASERKTKRDMIAAKILLQAFLDDGCPSASPDPLPLDDRP